MAISGLLERAVFLTRDCFVAIASRNDSIIVINEKQYVGYFEYLLNFDKIDYRRERKLESSFIGEKFGRSI